MPKRGEEPEQDALEKALLKTATRGVVRLFNAVSKAQRDQKDALVGGSRSRVRLYDLLMLSRVSIATHSFCLRCCTNFGIYGLSCVGRSFFILFCSSVQRNC